IPLAPCFLDVFLLPLLAFFFFSDAAPTEIYTLSLHDALPISPLRDRSGASCTRVTIADHCRCGCARAVWLHEHVRSRCGRPARRSEEHTSELQSRENLVCRLLLEKKKNTYFFI